jgi:zinc transporter ZupT
MSTWHAVLWGALGASSLLVGQAFARPLSRSPKATGLLMGFGAGTLIGAVGFELAPEASFEDVGLGVGAALAAGALTYYAADRTIDRLGGADRQTIVALGDVPRRAARRRAGGAVLTVLADSMMPEAFRHGGRAVGLLTVLGYIVAAALSVAQ